MGFHVSDAHGEDMMEGGAAFLRCNPDHHGIALFKATERNPAGAGLHHIAFEVAILDDVVRARAHLRAQWKGALSLEAAIADPVPGQDTSLRKSTAAEGLIRTVRALLPRVPP